jgi:hypothetical protein
MKKGEIKMRTDKCDLESLKAYVVSELKNIRVGEEFTVRALFRGFEWERILKGLRTKLGIWFIEEVRTERIANIQILGRTPQNLQIYRRVGK